MSTKRYNFILSKEKPKFLGNGWKWAKDYKQIIRQIRYYKKKGEIGTIDLSSKYTGSFMFIDWLDYAVFSGTTPPPYNIVVHGSEAENFSLISFIQSKNHIFDKDFS